MMMDIRRCCAPIYKITTITIIIVRILLVFSFHSKDHNAGSNFYRVIYVFPDDSNMCDYIACTWRELREVMDLELCKRNEIINAINNKLRPGDFGFPYIFKKNLPDGIYLFFENWHSKDTALTWYKNGKWKQFYTMMGYYEDSLRNGIWEYWYSPHPYRERWQYRFHRDEVKKGEQSKILEDIVTYNKGNVTGYFRCRNLYMGFIDSSGKNGYVIYFLGLGYGFDSDEPGLPIGVEIFENGKLIKAMFAGWQPYYKDTILDTFIFINKYFIDTTKGKLKPFLPWIEK